MFTALCGLTLLTTSGLSMAQQPKALLESPSASAFVRSGIGLIRGWACDAKRIEISIDDGERLTAGYGTLRTDTAQICGGKVDTGFGLTFNWNGIGDGIHNVRAFADGNEFANVNFTVTTLGKDFITNLTGKYLIPNFPLAGQNTPLQWSTAHQNFVIAKEIIVPPPANPPPATRKSLLESPTQGSSESGVGLIRGWVCDAKKVEISIDGGLRQATAYGTPRTDTQATCGDIDNGFGLTFNWNTLSAGVHQLQAFADNVEFAKVTFAVTNLGAEFLTGINQEIALESFPSAGERTTVRWSTPDQNFTLAQTTVTLAKAALVSLVNDVRNVFAVSGVGISSTDTTGVRVTKNALGLPTQLQGITWGDTGTGQSADIQLRADGLPDTYSDTKGFKAEFSNLTDNGITVTFKDKGGQPIGNPVNAPINIEQLLALQEVARQVFTQGQNTVAQEGRKLVGSTLLPTGYTTMATKEQVFTLNQFLANVFWHGSQAAGELLCAVAQAANTAKITELLAPTACKSPLISALRSSLAERQGQVSNAYDRIDPRAQQSLTFVGDVVDVPCATGDLKSCLTAAAEQLYERQAIIPPPVEPQEPQPPVNLFDVTGSWSGSFYFDDYPACKGTLRVQFEQRDTQLSGRGVATMNANAPAYCEPGASDSSSLSGTVEGNKILYGAASGLSYSGTIAPNGNSIAGSAVDAEEGLTSTWELTRN